MDNNLVRITYRVQVSNVNLKTGEVDALIPLSTGSMDRMDEVVLPSSMKKTLKEFKKRPVLVSSHDYWDLRKQIGHWAELDINDEGLYGKPRYYIGMGNEEADWAFILTSMNMAAFSIGFIPTKYKMGDGEKEPWVTYEEVELLEVSQVIVPANRDAIQGLKGKPAEYSQLSSVSKQLLKEAEAMPKLWQGVELVKTTEDDQLRGTIHLEQYGIKVEELEKVETIPELKAEDETTKPEETEDYIRVPNPKDEGNHEGHDIKTITISADEGISAIYCTEDKIIITYLFRKDKDWTMDKAKEWVAEHAKQVEDWLVAEASIEEGAVFDRSFTSWKGRKLDINPDADISQMEVADELSYCANVVEKFGMNAETSRWAWELCRQIFKTQTGGDIPDDIMVKAGAVLSAANKADLNKAAGMLMECAELVAGVLSRSETAEDTEKVYTKGGITEAVQEVLQEKANQIATDKEALKSAIIEVVGELKGQVK